MVRDLKETNFHMGFDKLNYETTNKKVQSGLQLQEKVEPKFVKNIDEETKKKVVKYSQTNWQLKQPRGEKDIKGNVSNSNLYHNESIFNLSSDAIKQAQKEAMKAKLAKKGL